MTTEPTIRTELAPRTVAAMNDARDRLRAGGPDELHAAVARWAVDERRGERGPKPRATDALVAERRAVVAVVLEDALAAGDQLTSRGVAYRLLSLGLPKAEPTFRRVEHSALVLRDSGLVPWEAVADGARRVLGHGRWPDAAAALAWLADDFRRDLWAQAPVQSQIWVEKAGIAAALAEHARALGVDLLPARGFSGAGFIRAAVADAAFDPRPLVLLVAGDGDSSGARALEAVERRARRDGRDLGVEVAAVERWAVTPEQVARLELPTRPNPPSTHRRDGDPTEAVELDAMPPAELRGALTAAVDRWCPPALREAARVREAADRAALAALVERAR